MSTDRGRKISLLFYELVLIISGLYVLERLWNEGFILDTVLVYAITWLVMVIIGGYYYFPRSAGTGVSP